MLIYYWLLLLIFTIIPPLSYYFYMKNKSIIPWKLNVEDKELPKITMLIPTYNEEKMIAYKLKNILKLNYPKELMIIIIIDSNSTDDTINEIKQFVKENNILCVKLIEEKIRKGKSHALNEGLKYVNTDIFIVSDSDCFLDPNSIKTALKFLDEKIGAIAGEERILNEDDSWIINNEKIYRENFGRIRLGESKIHSTIRFEGGFALYKKTVIDSFDTETGSDDSGTALNIVQKGYRTIFTPEINFYTFFPNTLKGKFTIKLRRANHLLRLWSKCLNLLLKNQLILPKKIAVPEIYLHLFYPTIFILFLSASVIITILYPMFIILILLILLIPYTRSYSIELILNNIIIFLGLISLILKKEFITWSIEETSRKAISESILKNKLLI